MMSRINALVAVVVCLSITLNLNAGGGSVSFKQNYNDKIIKDETGFTAIPLADWTFSIKVFGDFSNFDTTTEIGIKLGQFVFYETIQELVDLQNEGVAKIKFKAGKGGTVTFNYCYAAGSASKKNGTLTLTWSNKFLSVKTKYKNVYGLAEWQLLVDERQGETGNLSGETDCAVYFGDQEISCKSAYSGTGAESTVEKKVNGEIEEFELFKSSFQGATGF